MTIVGVWEICLQTSLGSGGRGGHEGEKEEKGTVTEGGIGEAAPLIL